MIVLRTPKGWTCPAEIDGKKCEDYWRSHQVPMGDMTTEEHVRILEGWMKSYRPEELFDDDGRLRPELADLAPTATGGWGRTRTRTAASCSGTCGCPTSGPTRWTCRPRRGDGRGHAGAGPFLRDVMKLNLEARNFRLFSPDECASNRWQDVFEATDRCYTAEIYPRTITCRPTAG
jgi:xylulose-5-phosphate/fructose-6-phosphate phosphoketolase